MTQTDIRKLLIDSTEIIPVKINSFNKRCKSQFYWVEANKRERNIWKAKQVVLVASLLTFAKKTFVGLSMCQNWANKS